MVQAVFEQLKVIKVVKKFLAGKFSTVHKSPPLGSAPSQLILSKHLHSVSERSCFI